MILLNDKNNAEAIYSDAIGKYETIVKDATALIHKIEDIVVAVIEQQSNHILAGTVGIVESLIVDEHPLGHILHNKETDFIDFIPMNDHDKLGTVLNECKVGIVDGLKFVAVSEDINQPEGYIGTELTDSAMRLDIFKLYDPFRLYLIKEGELLNSIFTPCDEDTNKLKAITTQANTSVKALTKNLEVVLTKFNIGEGLSLSGMKMVQVDDKTLFSSKENIDFLNCKLDEVKDKYKELNEQ